MNASFIIGIISLIFALPGIVVAINFPGYRAFAVLTIVVGVGLFLSWLRWWRSVDSPLWTVIDMHRTIEIKTQDGASACVTKTITVKANHKGLTQYEHRKIRSDGTIDNFKLNSSVVPAYDIQERVHEYMIFERFPQMKKGETRYSCLTYDLHNSFPNTHEFVGYPPDYFTKKCTLEVRFPQTRPARNPKTYSGVGAERKELSAPHIDPDGLTIRWEAKNLKPTIHYRVHWDW